MATDPVVAGIFAATPNSDTREAMLIGSRLESNWDPTAVGAGSYGAFQLQLSNPDAHPGVTIAEADDPAWAARFMEPGYQSAAAAQGSLWSSDPERAAVQAAVAAERPASPYWVTDGWGTVNYDWNLVQEAMKGQPITGTPGPGGSTPGVQTTSWYNPASWFGDAISSAVNSLVTGLEHDLIDVAAYASVLVVGASLVIIGLVRAASGGAKAAASSAPIPAPASSAAAAIPPEVAAL